MTDRKNIEPPCFGEMDLIPIEEFASALWMNAEELYSLEVPMVETKQGEYATSRRELEKYMKSKSERFYDYIDRGLY